MQQKLILMTISDIKEIRDCDQFRKISKDFDNRFNTTTMLFYSTLQDVAHKYTNWNRDTLNRDWEQTVGKVFRKSKIRNSNEMTSSEFTYLNNIVTFANSFKQFGFNIEHPIHIHYWQDRPVLHPGNKRIKILYQHYLLPIPVVITDYTNTHKDLGIDYYNFVNKNLFYWITDNHFSDPQKQYPMYKELNAHPHHFNDSSFGRNDRLVHPRVFELKNNTVLCDDKCILKKVNNTWTTDLEDYTNG